MKKVLLVFIITIMALFVACDNNSVVQMGSLIVQIDSNVSRGLQAVSMETASYSIVIKNASNEIVLSNSSSLETTYTLSAPAGLYTAEVQALNADGTVIGSSGLVECSIVAGEINSLTVVVSEIGGNGNFSIAITGNEGYPLAYSIKNASGTEIKAGSLAYAAGFYSAEQELANGFYTFTIRRTDIDKVIKNDSVRIINGQTVSYEAEFRFLSDGSITIINEIVSTPSISLHLNSETLSSAGTLTVSADISGIQNYTSYWTLDEEPLGEAAAYADLELDLDTLEGGEHTVALFVSSGNVAWSESAVFSNPGVFNGHYMGFVESLGYTYFFEIKDEHIRYSYYQNTIVEYDEVPYETRITDDGIYLIFRYADWREMDTALFVPFDKSKTSILYYEYGEDEKDPNNHAISIDVVAIKDDIYISDGTSNIGSDVYNVRFKTDNKMLAQLVDHYESEELMYYEVLFFNDDGIRKWEHYYNGNGICERLIEFGGSAEKNYVVGIDYFNEDGSLRYSETTEILTDESLISCNGFDKNGNKLADVRISDISDYPNFAEQAQSLTLRIGNNVIGRWNSQYETWSFTTELKSFAEDLPVEAEITMKDGYSEHSFPYMILPNTSVITVEEGCSYTIIFTIVKKEYEVGDKGPSGGYIFYDCDADNDTGNNDGLISSECGWRYLETAPADLKIIDGIITVDPDAPGYSSGDHYFVSGYYRISEDNLFVNGTVAFNAEDCTGTKLGAGEINTVLLVSAMGDVTFSGKNGEETTSQYAAKLCLDLVYNGFDDWFLPSKDELNLLYTNKNAITGFCDFFYWSSSEGVRNSGDAASIWVQKFSDGRQADYDRDNTLCIRPVRSF